MGLDAVVYRNKQHLPFDADAAGAYREPTTGEYYCADLAVEQSFDRKYPSETRASISKRLGNVSLIAFLREEAKLYLDKNSVVLSKVLYSGTHAGDVIGSESLSRLEAELRQVQRSERHVSKEMVEFITDLQELIIAARLEGNPIVFV
ncbi:MAG TPA: hypothetical protein VK812_01730 [Candidatus Binatus sp.]|jgi:hypothetical protein|nr:hypothetical protein [Candidatus Binatus sp.]